jgi:hypothetical protein
VKSVTTEGTEKKPGKDRKSFLPQRTQRKSMARKSRRSESRLGVKTSQSSIFLLCVLCGERV